MNCLKPKSTENCINSHTFKIYMINKISKSICMGYIVFLWHFSVPRKGGALGQSIQTQPLVMKGLQYGAT
jgi:hypothetical protein